MVSQYMSVLRYIVHEPILSLMNEKENKNTILTNSGEVFGVSDKHKIRVPTRRQLSDTPKEVHIVKKN